MTFVFKPSEAVRKKLTEYYKDLCKPKAPPYAVFQAMEADTTITLYESGKVMFQGISADIDFDIWATLEKKVSGIDVRKDDKKDKKETKEEINYDFLKKISTVGSDEVGTGDYFGPIIVVSAYVPKDKLNLMDELKITDSKKITDDKIKELAPILMKELIYTAYALTNEEFNNLEDTNMNKVKAILHNKVLMSIMQKGEVKPEKVVVDQFTTPKSYYFYLKDSSNVLRNITFLTKAESKCYSVAAASIIARYLFLAKINELSNELGKTIPLGAGVIVDDFAKKLVEEKGKDILKKVTKYNFKNTQKILD